METNIDVSVRAVIRIKWDMLPEVFSTKPSRLANVHWAQPTIFSLPQPILLIYQPISLVQTTPVSPPKPLKLNSPSWHFTAEILPLHLLTLPSRSPLFWWRPSPFPSEVTCIPQDMAPRALSAHYLPRCCVSVPTHSHVSQSPQMTPSSVTPVLILQSKPSRQRSSLPLNIQNNVFASLVAPILCLVIVVPTNPTYGIASS